MSAPQIRQRRIAAAQRTLERYRTPAARKESQHRRPHLDLIVAQRELSAPRQGETRRPDQRARDRKPIGGDERKKDVRRDVIKRFMTRMDRLKSAERERDRCETPTRGLNSQTAGVDVDPRGERQVVQEHRDAIRLRRHRADDIKRCWADRMSRHGSQRPAERPARSDRSRAEACRLGATSEARF